MTDDCKPRYHMPAIVSDESGPETVIINTVNLPSATKLMIAATGGVIEQEKRGQEELVASKQLPIDGLLGEADRPRWEALGVKILDDGKSDDPLFCRVELPAGWRKIATPHNLWTNLVDETGKVRASICYKAAFYDRYARIQLKRDPDAVCAVCGHEQLTTDPCESCGSVRVIPISIARQEFGENWRETCFGPDPRDSKESP